MMKGSGAGSVLVTNGSGCGSGRPKNIRILLIWIPTLAFGFFGGELILCLCVNDSTV